MAFVTIEDNAGEVELVLFPSVWETCGSQVESGALLLVKGKVDHRESGVSVLADQVSRVDTSGLKDLHVDNRNQGPYYEQVLEKYLPDIATLSRFAHSGYAEAAAEPESASQGTPVPQNAEAFEEPEWEENTYASFPPAAAAAPVSEPDLPEAAELQPAAAMPPEPEETPSKRLPSSPAPVSGGSADKELKKTPRLLVTIQSCGERERDIRHIKQIHGFLTSHPGENHFCFHIMEAGCAYEIEFPNETTEINERILKDLSRFVGEANVQVRDD
jgi:DNA polymerase-3 subunit alpha